MYKTISNEIIRKFNLGYDPSKFITDENEELPIKEWVQKYRNVVPANDILWLLLRKEFLSEKDLRLFVVWCAREVLKLVENPDERSVEACNVAERYANGKATKEELLAAHDAARAAFYVSAIAARDIISSADANVAANAANAANAAACDASNIARTAQVDKLLTYFE
jgi:hypothetical protein